MKKLTAMAIFVMNVIILQDNRALHLFYRTHSL